ncbi:MAG: aminotransferase class I/II-fold pyridoxal phosphate-dependent enzyme, partial [Gammaproteobacteria bacterium]|nr:aminotransferase class I/II-fold pyridoxal phosphate-dependent enzyme [Gammaproteobacteria bacterium]
MQPFVMERWQSHYENTVRYNLSESGVHPLTLRELLALADGDGAVDPSLGYGQTNGTVALRERIAALYDGADPDRVVVTNGGAEANFLSAWSLVGPGDGVAVLTPTYMQLPGLAQALGGRLRRIPLREELGWQPAPEDVAAAIDEATRLVVVTNPQNPTGVRLTDTSIAAVLGAAERVGAWVL